MTLVYVVCNLAPRSSPSSTGNLDDGNGLENMNSIMKLASFPGLLHLQFLTACSMQPFEVTPRLSITHFSLRLYRHVLQAIKNWRWRRPGNDAVMNNKQAVKDNIKIRTSCLILVCESSSTCWWEDDRSSDSRLKRSCANRRSSLAFCIS